MAEEGEDGEDMGVGDALEDVGVLDVLVEIGIQGWETCCHQTVHCYAQVVEVLCDVHCHYVVDDFFATVVDDLQ